MIVGECMTTRMHTGNCFRCGKTGHWISDCPLKTEGEDPPPAIYCTCGGGLCEIKVSNTRENPKRKFYKCSSQNCRFFKWCDKVTDEDIRFRPSFTIPNCPCGSGPCRRVVADAGPNAGRAYLQCAIKKGFGACGFFKWEDADADADADGVEIPPSCDAADEMDFWAEADLVLSDLESSFQAARVPDNANQMANEGQCSVNNTEDDSIFENFDVMSVSDLHSAAAATANQEVTANQEATSEQLMKSVHVEQPTSCVDEAMSVLVRDAVSSGSVMKHETKNHDDEKIGVSEAEWSFPNLQDLMEQYNSEKLRLESISGKHVQVLSAFMSSYSRLRLLHEKTGHLRKLLLETENEMASCEAETLELGVSCREVAGEMAESQKRMQETADKLGKEVEVLKQKEFVDLKRRKS